MTNAEMKARKKIKALKTKDIIIQFELTERMNNAHIPTVRGWLMDELEKRDPKAFDAWMDSDDESPRRFYR